MKLNNLLDFSDFVKSWNPEQQKKTKRTEIGLDIIKENSNQKFFVSYSERVGLLCIELDDTGVELAKENIEGLEQVFNGETKKYINKHDNPKIEIKKVLFDKINIHSYFVETKMEDESPVSINLTLEQVEEILEEAKEYNLASEEDFM